MVDLSVKLSSLTLDNPIIPASGTFGYGKEHSQFYDINILGSFSFKGTTKEPRFGNPTPRIAECPSGMINSVGLQNPGIDHVVNHEIEEIKNYFSKPVIANIGGFSVDEFVHCAKMLDECENVGILEINISCPNVHTGGTNFGTSEKGAYEVTYAVKNAVKKPVFVKLTPNVTDIVTIAKAVEAAGADGLTLINTLFGMRIDIHRRRPVLANKFGGVSGDAVFPIALRMIYQVYEQVKLPIMGCGGVSTPEDVIEMMLAGATGVQVGAANLIDPYASFNIINGLTPLCEKLKIEKLSDIIGGGHV